mgnify:CR=1 FL=1
MNDPGLDKPAMQAAEDVEANNTQFDQEQAEEEEQEFLKPGYASLRGSLSRRLLISAVGGGLHLLLVRS